MVHPRENKSDPFVVGVVVLEDFREGLEAKGLPVGSEIQRFVDGLDRWINTTWTASIPIYGRNKVIYARTRGANVTLPDHVLELMA